jgi:putative PIN family toxin of toxin-antitoxin system
MSGLIRVVLDTNVIVSGTAYPKGIPGKLLDLWRSGSLAVVLSPYLLTELERVLPRVPSAAFNVADVPRIVQAFGKLAEIVDPLEHVDSELRDQADQPVLGTLLASVRTISSPVTKTCSPSRINIPC